MATLAEIRAKLKAQDTKSSGTGGFGGDNAIYPHWNIAEGTEAVLRFLPDKDPNNTFFWVERAMIKLPFNSNMFRTILNANKSPTCSVCVSAAMRL